MLQQDFTILAHHYIPSDEFLLTHYDKRSQKQKATDIALSVYREFQYAAEVVQNRCCKPAHLYQPCSAEITWKTDSQGLYVLIHGLNGHPSIWNYHLNELSQISDIDLFVPFVPEGGNCTLEQAATPILKKMIDYTQHHPSKPICLIGVSNGGRLATWIETQLRHHAARTAIKVSTIAGVHFGSSRMDAFEMYRLSKIFWNSNLNAELSFGSQKARELLDEIRKPCLPETEREYEFYASTEDMHVPELGSSLPILNKGEKYHVVHGYGHNSLVKGVYKQQIESCELWRLQKLKLS